MSQRIAARAAALGAAALAFVLGSAAVPAQAAADAALLAAATAAQPAVIESLKEMVAIESGSGNAEGVGRMADYVERRLAALGARTERPRATTGSSLLVKGSLTGSGTRRVLLIAHMDTVYPAGTLATQPIRLDGNRLYGPGIVDDKGGIAVILHSLEILKARGWTDYAKVTVLFNSDEETGSLGSGELIAAAADEHDVVLSCEPTAAKVVAKNEALLLGASGAATATLKVEGRASHAGAAPDMGRNALIELSHQLLQTRDVAKSIPGTQINWTLAQAGRVINQIPESAQATGDVRLTVKDGAEKLQAALRQKIAAGTLVPDAKTTLTIEVVRPPFIANDAGRSLAKRAQAIYAEMDGRPLTLVDMTGASTDAAFAGRSGRAAVIESFGLAGFGYHARDEYVELDSIVPRLYLMTRLLTTL